MAEEIAQGPGIEFLPNGLAADAPIIVGFYTPNYEALATKFAKHIQTVGLAHRLYAVDNTPAWLHATLLKPGIVLRAMDDYPDRVIVLMDIDCILSGDITQMVMDIRADTGIYISAWSEHRAYPLTMASSRMIVFRPTPGARRLAEAWDAECTSGRARNDEASLMHAISKTMGFTIETIPLVAEVGSDTVEPKSSLVAHVSAHTNVYGRPKRRFTRATKTARRYLFRVLTGRDYKAWKYYR